MHPAEWVTPAMFLALAGLIWRGFERVGSRIDRLEGRVDRVESKSDSRFERLEGKIDSLSEQLQSIAVDVAVLKDRATRDSGHAPQAPHAANG
jgi:hypothetical protein